MRRHTFKKRLLALVLGALFVGLAPLLHALCVAPVAAATSMVHIMADGSSMVMGDVTSQSGTASGNAIASAIAIASASPSPSPTVVPSTLGSIIVAVGLAVLTFFGLRRCAQTPSILSSRATGPPTGSDRWPGRILLRPYAVSLDSLGISRT